MADFTFRKYRRIQVAELRPVNLMEINGLRSRKEALDGAIVSISEEDAKAGSPKLGDMIGRNPDNHADQWLISAAYFAKNFALEGEAWDAARAEIDHARGVCDAATCAQCIDEKAST